MTPGQQAATAALGRAVADRRAGEDRGPEVTAIVARLRLARQHNHFSESIGQLYQGGQHQ